MYCCIVEYGQMEVGTGCEVMVDERRGSPEKLVLAFAVFQ